tara:strand:- start:978 stop:1238 length:261 start_codon:yes stop_codon:yes gene_type:complete
MITKTSIAIDKFRKGDFKGSLKLFQKFRIGLSKADQDRLRIAHEILAGQSMFYKQLDLDVDQIVSDARVIISDYVTEYDNKLVNKC